MTTVEILEGELCLLNVDGEIIHVFERSGKSQVEYKFMSDWIQRNFDSKLETKVLWEGAEEAWANLGPENQAFLFSLFEQEKRNAKDICEGLLATLAEYQGLKTVKDAYRRALNNALEQFTSS